MAQFTHAFRSQVPTQHQADFDAALGGESPAVQNGVGGFFAALLALLKAIGANVNWTCILSVIPQAIAAFSNPALWPAVIAAYFACANPTP